MYILFNAFSISLFPQMMDSNTEVLLCLLSLSTVKRTAANSGNISEVKDRDLCHKTV